MTELDTTRAPAGDHGYPRPDLQRDNWMSLNGTWDFAMDAAANCRAPSDVQWNQSIQVPFSPETRASGVLQDGPFRACWYRRVVDPPAIERNQRLLLHFGAVDHEATVWINGAIVGSHEGGYTPFTFDVTPNVETAAGRRLEIVVRAYDDPLDLSKPRGKQDWLPSPHSIWYPRTTGIWQTVWFEAVPETYIDRVRWTPSLERWEIGFEAWLAGVNRDGLRMRVKLGVGSEVLADDTYTIVAGEVHRRIALSDPGIDDYRNGLLWNPATPTLIDVEIELWADRGNCLDSVRSYTALRSIAVDGDRFSLNGRPFQLRMVLDQGYWPESGGTAPDDDALRRDIELVKSAGFNGVRKHQKIEDPRYLYWADRLGLLVWEEMPSAYRFTRLSVQRVMHEWLAVIDRDFNHPCIIAWVPINESWGVPNLPTAPAERHYVQSLYYVTKTLDPTRPVIGNDGWESVATDIIGIHDYDGDPDRIARRYRADDVLPRLFKRERPGGRVLVLQGDRQTDQPIMLTEFGGINIAASDGTWGYSQARSVEDYAQQYERLLAVVHSLGVFAGFCYTQFCDTYQEANGLFYADRVPKFSIERIAAATRGTRSRVPDTLQQTVGSTNIPAVSLTDEPVPPGTP
jgi:beta-galactosidase/beta-glucuronidase